MRWIGMGAAGVLALVALTLAGVWTVAANLSHPFVKTRVQALALEQAGLEIDYQSVALSWTRGLRAHGLRVLQPAKFHAAAATFIDVSELEVKLNALGWARGSRTIDALRIGALKVTVVRDAAGASTLSELFPAAPPSPTEPRTAGRWSQALDNLPVLHVTRVDLERARAELLEPNGAQISLGSFGLHGAVTLAPGDLSGTDLQLTAAPALRLERRAHDSVQYARLGLRAHLWADAPQTLSLEAESTLQEQTLWPTWTAPRELVRLTTRLQLDPASGTSSIACPNLRVLGDTATATVDVQLSDGAAPRLTADGRVDIALPSLPISLPGISLAALTVRLEAKQLSFQGDRLAGSVDWLAGLEELVLDEPQLKSAVRGVQLRGRGSFDGPVGHITATAQIASGAWTGVAAGARFANLALDVEGTTEREAQAQQVAADAKLRLTSLQLTATDLPTIDLAGIELDSHAAGSVAELARKQLPNLLARLAVTRVTARDARQHEQTVGSGAAKSVASHLALDLTRARARARARSLAVVEPLTAVFEGRQLTSDEASPSGLRGAAEVTLDLPSLRIWERRASRQQPSIAMRDLHLQARMPLGLEQVRGSLAIHSLRAQGRALESTQLTFDLKEPLTFPLDAASSHASAHVAGKLGDVRSGTHRAVIEELRLDAERLDRQRYRVEFASTVSSLNASGKPVSGPITAELHASTAPALGALTLTAAVRGSQGALIELDAATELSRGDRLKYRARVAASKLDAFAGLIASLAPNAAELNLTGATVEARARGALGGVLRRRADAMPAFSPQPLRTVRGEQSLEIELAGLDYRAPDQALVIPKLTLEAGSDHGAEGAGSAHATLKASTLEYDRAGQSIRLEGIDHTLQARFDRAPSDGLVDVRAELALASATQSWFPRYPIGALLLSARVELAQLRSILVRELSLNNPLAGTELSARGALELRARPGAGDLTIAGREALQIEGSLSQALERFETLGYAEHARGALRVPFRLESGGLLGYRLFAAIEAQHISYSSRELGFGVEDLNGAIPVVEELALLPGVGRPVVSVGPRTSPFAAARFIDVHPFVTDANYLTAQSLWVRGIAPLGPLAANVRIERSDFLIDQLQAGFNSGQIVGQIRASYRDGDPIVRVRLNGTGLRAAAGGDVFDANASLTFVPNTLTLDGKLQLVRGSRAHLLAILDVVDPFHDSVGANRVRLALRFGYPKFVRFHLHDGAIDTKVELGGLAQLVRIDEIKATPLGPIMQRYVAPALALEPRPTAAELVAQTDRPEAR